MNVLITGAGGFVGKHLLTYLRQHSAPTLHGTVLDNTQLESVVHDTSCQWWVLDLRDPQAVRDLLEHIQPDQIFHLAGQAYVPRSFEDPWETLDNNIRGTLNLLMAIHELKLSTRFLNVGSAEIYGPASADKLPLTEDSAFIPGSPYSVSKIAQDMLAYQYFNAYKLHTIRVRPFNHIGTGQNMRFAASDWASQIAEAEIGKREPVVYVGNLSAARDFTDVRDVVRAYSMAVERGQAGDVFNVCSGKPRTMQSILDILVGLSRVKIDVRVDQERFRPVDIPSLYGDYSHLHQRTGWQPEISIEQTLNDVLDEWRQRIATS
ncbi:MAG: GDP-mannose 4,6-dehydratase [Anaerolineae bacterium]|nr:GDP-mannose 4,6-dehydratase [Anaerolineae bacterium]